MSIPFVHPFTCLVSGPTGCGKTQFVFRLIDHVDTMFQPRPEQIVYCFNEYQPIFERCPNVIFQQGLPKMEQFNGEQSTLLVLDDLMSEADERIQNMFTRGSHHKNISIIFMVQNFFSKNKYMHTICLNAQYIVLFKNPRDASQFTSLARQLYPDNPRFAQDSYKDATQRPYSYLLVDCRPDTIEELRLRAHIFPDDERHFVYVQK